MAKFRNSRKSEKVEHKAVPMTSPGQQSGPVKEAEDFEKLMEASRSAVGPDTFPPASPEPDRKTKLVRRIDAARVLAEQLGDKPTMDGLGDLSERIAREQLDEAGFEDMEKLLGEIQKGLEEAAGPRAIHVSFEDMPAEEQTRLVEELRKHPPILGDLEVLPDEQRRGIDDTARLLSMSGIKVPPDGISRVERLAAVTGAVENLEQEAWKAATEARVQRLSEEYVALEHIRRFTSPGESLVQAVERLEKLANAGADLLPMVGGDLKTRAVGVIVEDVEKERHVVHVFERGGGSLRVWAYNKGEKMPWHAARDVVEKLVETRITPEDKR
jgi:hypothetical protein